MSKEFNGTLQDAIIEMLNNQTDHCYITHTCGDVDITVKVTIQQIIEKGEIVYDAIDAGDVIEEEATALMEAEPEYLN
jgi:hypothetical protein